MTRASLAFEHACESSWDAIVVGAGPAGALAARQLAAGGGRVLLVEKKVFPRWKVCGACLNGQSLALLKAVDLGSSVAGLGAIELDAFELQLARRSARFNLPAGVALSRTRFDAALVDAAIAAGAHFVSETQACVENIEGGLRRVLLLRPGSTLTASARVVLVAAGLSHTCLERDLPIQTQTHPGSRIGAGCVVESFPSCFHERTIFMALGRSGYVGLVRLKDGVLNVAAALDVSFVRRCGGPSRAAAWILAEAGYPAIPALQSATWQGTAQLTRRVSPPAAERLLLIGDAAGYVEPFTGEGIAWALLSAHAAAPIALRGIERWEPSLQREWAAVHRRLIARRQWLCRSLSMLLRHPWLARQGFELAARIPALTKVMLDHLNAPAVLSRASYP